MRRSRGRPKGSRSGPVFGLRAPVSFAEERRFETQRAEGARLPGRVVIGRNVRALRMAKGLSQDAFAFDCNLHRTYIGSIERGERNISIDNMERIAEALNVEISDLLRPIGAALPSVDETSEERAVD